MERRKWWIVMVTVASLVTTVCGKETETGCGEWGECGDKCCAWLRQTKTGPEAPACLPCESVPERGCVRLEKAEAMVGRSLRQYLPSVRLHLRAAGLLPSAQLNLCSSPGCNLPPVHPHFQAHQLTSHHCWYDTPLNAFFPASDADGKALILICPSLLQCCASVILPAHKTWGLGCVACPSLIRPPHTHPRVSPTEVSPWTNDTLVCISTPPTAKHTPAWNQTFDADKDDTTTTSLPSTPAKTTSTVATTQKKTTYRWMETTEKDEDGASGGWMSRTGTSRRRRPPTRTNLSLDPDYVGANECTGKVKCSGTEECCARIGGEATNGHVLHFCIPCNLVEKTAIPGSSMEASPRCATVGTWEQASMVSLDPFLPSVRSLLSLRKPTPPLTVLTCNGPGCNRPIGFHTPVQAFHSHWCWHNSPLNRFFYGNTNGTQAAMSECGRYQYCCSSVQTGQEVWAVGCVECEPDSGPAFEEAWERGELSPWSQETELCGWPRPKGHTSPSSSGLDERRGSTVCQAKGVEPHFSWSCPPEVACCLTAGSEAKPHLPRLPSCLPCRLTTDLTTSSVHPAEPRCHSFGHWRNVTKDQVLPFLPTLRTFFLHHNWVLSNATALVCRGYDCNRPPGFKTPPNEMRKNGTTWCWHASPMNKYFRGNERGDKAIFAGCHGGERCCSSLELMSGEKWALGCHSCRGDEPRREPAIQFFTHYTPSSPWDEKRSEMCVWNPAQTCYVVEVKEREWEGGVETSSCPHTSCCYSALSGGRVVGAGCAPCSLPDTCHSWARHLIQSLGRRVEERPLADLFQPPPRAEFGTEQSVCICRGALCNRQPQAQSRPNEAESEEAVAASLTPFEAQLVSKAALLKASARRILLHRRSSEQMVAGPDNLASPLASSAALSFSIPSPLTLLILIFYS